MLIIPGILPPPCGPCVPKCQSVTQHCLPFYCFCFCFDSSVSSVFASSTPAALPRPSCIVCQTSQIVTQCSNVRPCFAFLWVLKNISKDFVWHICSHIVWHSWYCVRWHQKKHVDSTWLNSLQPYIAFGHFYTFQFSFLLDGHFFFLLNNSIFFSFWDFIGSSDVLIPYI